MSLPANTSPVLLVLLLTLISWNLTAQVQLRDTLVVWQHHAFDLNADYSMSSYSTSDSDIETVAFVDAKVIENEWIRLVVIPEYGARVLSFVYKPTGHEYLYQSECGSAYGMGQGNFYYDWLMVYGGIFPTFPESEHGKTWLVPWQYSVIQQSDDTVTIRMEYTDNTSFSGAPWRFNNGTTQMTCQVDVSVYRDASIWDFDVRLINNQSSPVIYEYWTCTTLAPGSDIGDTGSPLNSEMIIPASQYFAGWSPGGWIGDNNAIYSMSDIDYLSEWDDMGIAYAHNFSGRYWGVINHDEEEGIFRLADNTETPGLKLWTWGSGNVDNDMFDFSNGGADNYIELWAGVSEAFFVDATMPANAEKSWTESYCPTVNLSAICNINQAGAVSLDWENDESRLAYELNTFHADREYVVNIILNGNGTPQLIAEDSLSFAALGRRDTLFPDIAGLLPGNYQLQFDLLDLNGDLALRCTRLVQVGSTAQIPDGSEGPDLRILPQGDLLVRVENSSPAFDQFELYNLSGQLLADGTFEGNALELRFPMTGLYFLRVYDGEAYYTEKVLVRE